MTCGARLSAREGRRGYRFGMFPGWAVGLIRDWAGLTPQAFFHIFLFLFLFFFSFLIYFILFANLIQINSNHFLNFSKIQHNVLKQ
jgi:hypothetical protein